MNQQSFATDPLVSQTSVKKQLGDVIDMTMWRWRRQGILPPPIVINTRNYWRQSQIDAITGRIEERGAA